MALKRSDEIVYLNWTSLPGWTLQNVLGMMNMSGEMKLAFHLGGDRSHRGSLPRTVPRR